MFISPSWAAESFVEEDEKEKVVFSDYIDRLIIEYRRDMLEMDFPSEFGKYPIIPRDVNIKKQYWFTVVSGRIEVTRGVVTSIMGHKVPQYISPLIYNKLTKVINTTQATYWFAALKRQHAMMALMNGAHVTLPNYRGSEMSVHIHNARSFEMFRNEGLVSISPDVLGVVAGTHALAVRKVNPNLAVGSMDFIKDLEVSMRNARK